MLYLVHRPLKSFRSVNQFIASLCLVRLWTVVPVEIVQADHECKQHLKTQQAIINLGNYFDKSVKQISCVQ